MKGLQETVGIRNANWNHHDEHRSDKSIVCRCFNVNLNADPENSKLNKQIFLCTIQREFGQVVSANSPCLAGTTNND
ncbi:hypothetical protein HYZ41_04080 [archaeon]|nr:hypothetical protein [archaeon]